MQFLRLAEWVGLCLFVAPAVLVDLRLLGLARHWVRVSDTVQYVLPFTATGFAILVAARGGHVIATPSELLGQPVFLLHVALVTLLGVNVGLFHAGIFKTVDAWELGPVPPRARLTGVLSLLLFAGIVATASFVQ